MDKRMIRIPDALLQHGRSTPPVLVAIFAVVVIFIAFTIALVIAVLIYVATIPFDLYLHGMYNISSFLDVDAILLMLLVFEVLIAVFAIIYVKKIEKRPLNAMGFTRKRWAERYAVGFGIGAAALAAAAAPFLVAWNVQFIGFKPIALVYMAAFALQGASEEVLFRGMLMPALARRIPTGWAVGISALVFAAMHIGGDSSVFYYVWVFSSGVGFAAIMLRYRSIWAACGAHGAWNFMAVLLVPNALSGYDAGYGLFWAPGSTGALGVLGEPIYMVMTGVWLAVAALMLFAGKKKLVRRVSHGQWMAATAMRISTRMYEKKASGPELALAAVVRDMVDADEEKAAASLAGGHARKRYTPDWLRRRGFSEAVCRAVDVMRQQPGEDAYEYIRRVAEDSIARNVKAAQLRHMLATDYADPDTEAAVHYRAFLREAAAMLEGAE